MNQQLLGEPWYSLLQEEVSKDYFTALKEELTKEYGTYKIWPKPHEIFKAYQLTPPESVKIVMLSQDPYPFGQADGLAFSASNTVETPFSLRMIFRELDRDITRTNNHEEYKQSFPNNDLSPWSREGVFLLNTVLTVRAGESSSHSKLGWQQFTTKTLDLLYEDDRPKVFVAWGSDAQRAMKKYDWSKHLLLETGHPASGAHAKDKYSGNNHFSRANNWLSKQGIQPINWKLGNAI